MDLADPRNNVQAAINADGSLNVSVVGGTASGGAGGTVTIGAGTALAGYFIGEGVYNTSVQTVTAGASAPLQSDVTGSLKTIGQPQIVTGSATTRPANTTGYGFGQLVANSTASSSVAPGTIAAARGINTPSTILRCRLLKTGTGITNAIFRIHLYNVAPTVANGDGGVWLSNQAANYLGSMDVTIDKVMSDGAVGNGFPSVGATIAFAPLSGSQNIYYLIEARAAYTPASGEVFTPILEVQ